ncbi:MAG: hypothetical protein RBS39_09935 [Phycisphaerales bacterium]|jgi:hypothetical protein|nr:hypothetical protein [Phycisphaerales bacterium]
MMRRRAFTIIELAVSSVVVALIMGSIVSVMTLTTRVVAPGTPAENDLAPAMARMTEEIAEARTFRSLEADGITFTLADRNADGSADVVAYDWPGAGSPLYVTRAARNRSAVTPVLDGARFIATTTTTSEAAPDNLERRATSALASNSSSNGTVSANSSVRLSQYVLPTLPAGAISWSLERIEFSMANVGLGGTLDAYLYLADAQGKPTGSELDRENVSSGLLSITLGWKSVDLSKPDLAPTQGVNVVLVAAGSTASFNISFANEGSPSMALLVSSDSGATWAVSPVVSLTFRVYGTALVRASGGTTTRDFVETVNIELTPEGADQPIIMTAVPAMGGVVE